MINKKKVLVTGADGFIGSHLVKKFLDEGHKVFILDANINYFYPLDDFTIKNLEWRNKNLTKDAKIFKFNFSKKIFNKLKVYYFYLINKNSRQFFFILIWRKISKKIDEIENKILKL